MLERLTASDFEELTGENFKVREPEVVLRLERVAAVMESERARLNRQPFSLFFRGPASPHLLQRTYTLEHAAFPEPLPIFLVPVGHGAEGFEYEAVFT